MSTPEDRTAELRKAYLEKYGWKPGEGLFPPTATGENPPGWEPTIPKNYPQVNFFSEGTETGIVPPESKPARIPQESLNATPTESSGLIPPTTGTPFFSSIPTPQAKTSADLAREDAMREYQTHLADVQAGKKPSDSGFGLSPLFYAAHPGISGGVFVGPNGHPKFLFNENKPQEAMGAVNDLISQWVDKAKTAMGATSGNPLYDAKVFNQIMNEFPGTLNANAGNERNPAEIARLMVEATRPQVVPNVASGNIPGQETSFLIRPGGSPTPFATGMAPSAGHAENLAATLITQAYNRNAERQARALTSHPSFWNSPEETMKIMEPLFTKWNEETRNEINSIPQMIRANIGAPTATAPTKMTYQEYYTKLKAKGYTDQQINAEWPVVVAKGFGG